MDHLYPYHNYNMAARLEHAPIAPPMVPYIHNYPLPMLHSPSYNQMTYHPMVTTDSSTLGMSYLPSPVPDPSSNARAAQVSANGGLPSSFVTPPPSARVESTVAEASDEEPS